MRRRRHEIVIRDTLKTHIAFFDATERTNGSSPASIMRYLQCSDMTGSVLGGEGVTDDDEEKEKREKQGRHEEKKVVYRLWR